MFAGVVHSTSKTKVRSDGLLKFADAAEIRGELEGPDPRTLKFLLQTHNLSLYACQTFTVGILVLDGLGPLTSIRPKHHVFLLRGRHQDAKPTD